MTITVVDRGAARRLIALARARRARHTVDVGVIGENAAEVKPEGVTVGLVAAWAELGLGQPQRSWLRGYINENEKEIEALITQENVKVLQTDQTKSQALHRIGIWLVGQIQTRISEGIPPENAQSTIDRKGSSTPLIDTGQLRSSMSSRVNP